MTLKEQAFLDRIEKLHAEIKANPSAKFDDCEKDNQHSFWEPELIFKKKDSND